MNVKDFLRAHATGDERFARFDQFNPDRFDYTLQLQEPGGEVVTLRNPKEEKDGALADKRHTVRPGSKLLAVGTAFWDWRARKHVTVGIDIDTDDKHAGGLVKGEFEAALEATRRVPWWEVRRSSGGKPVYMDSITTVTIDAFKAKRAKESALAPIRRKAKAKEPGEPKEAVAKPRRVASATVNKELRHIRAALRKAWRWEMLPQPPEVTMLREPQRDPYFIDDATFKALYDACGAITRPAGRLYPAADWWRALLCFAYMTGWRIGEILELRRPDLDLEAGIATVDAESTKGRREARVELHPVVIQHVRAILEFQPFVFDWPHHERTLWEDFAELKKAAGMEFPGAFHRLRFGFANANVDKVDAMLLQKLMRHQSQQTTRHYINMAERLKNSGTAAKIHIPEFLKAVTG